MVALFSVLVVAGRVVDWGPVSYAPPWLLRPSCGGCGVVLPPGRLYPVAARVVRPLPLTAYKALRADGGRGRHSDGGNRRNWLGGPQRRDRLRWRYSWPVRAYR